MKKSEQVRVRVTPSDVLQLERLAELLGQNRAGTLRYLIRHADLAPPRLHLAQTSSLAEQEESSRRKDGLKEPGAE